MKLKNEFLLQILTSLVLFGCFLGCGRMSQPKPPEERAPAGVRSARIEPSSRSLRIFWQAPLETASGDELMYLKSFYILRRVVKKDGSPNYSEIADIQVDEQSDSEKEYSYEDQSVDLGVVYEYLVVPKTDEGIEGTPTMSLRVSFLGAGSLVESLPYSDSDQEPVEEQTK